MNSLWPHVNWYVQMLFLQLKYLMTILAITIKLATLSAGKSEKLRMCAWIIVDEECLNYIGKAVRNVFYFCRIVAKNELFDGVAEPACNEFPFFLLFHWAPQLPAQNFYESERASFQPFCFLNYFIFWECGKVETMVLERSVLIYLKLSTHLPLFLFKDFVF